MSNKVTKTERRVFLSTYFEKLILQKREAGKHSTADIYRATNNWLKEFTKGNTPMLREISSGFVDNFYSYLQSQKHLKTNSIVCYINNFRAMYNMAVRERILHPKHYPFKHLSLHKKKTAKRALSKKMIENICRLDLQQNPELKIIADLSVFSYMACGMPFIDLVHLCKENIIGNEIVYNRIKTGTLVRIRITEGMQLLLDKYQGMNDLFLFPLLKKGLGTTHEEYKAILQYYNRNLKIIGEMLNMPIPLTSYVIRHSWATEALRQHIPIAVISQALGHSSERTTRYYLDQLDQSELDEANALITGSVENILLNRA